MQALRRFELTHKPGSVCSNHSSRTYVAISF